MTLHRPDWLKAVLPKGDGRWSDKFERLRATMTGTTVPAQRTAQGLDVRRSNSSTTAPRRQDCLGFAPAVQGFRLHQANAFAVPASEDGSKAATAKISPRVDVSKQFDVGPSSRGISFRYGDPHIHGIRATVDGDGVLGFVVRSASNHADSRGSGRDMLYSLLQRLADEGVEVTAVRGIWADTGDSANYYQYKQGIESGITPEEAALNTWTGRRAHECGFQNIRVMNAEDDIVVIFERSLEMQSTELKPHPLSAGFG